MNVGLAQSSFGIGLRRPHFDAIVDGPLGVVDFLEVVPENFMKFGGRALDVLRRAAARWPIIVHGTGMSLGGPDPLDETYLHDLGTLLDLVDAPWFSDHVSTSSGHGSHYFDLLPLPFTDEAVTHVVARIRQVQDQLRRPFLIENPSYYVALPGAEMTEAQFIAEIAERADCGLLLDVNNVFVNATNHGYDPREFIAALPADRIAQLHIAGHHHAGDMLIDTHGSHICPEVFDLLAHTVKLFGPRPTLLEWDNDIPPLEILLAEQDKVREVALAARAGA